MLSQLGLSQFLTCHSWDCPCHEFRFSIVTVGIVTVGIRVIVTTIVELRIQVLNCHRSLGMYRQNVLSLSQVEAGRVERGVHKSNHIQFARYSLPSDNCNLTIAN